MYQKSQLNAVAPPPDNNVRSTLNNILDRASSLHGRIDGLIETMFGPQPQAAADPIIGATPNMNYDNLLDSIEFRLNGIDHAIEFLSARL